MAKKEIIIKITLTKRFSKQKLLFSLKLKLYRRFEFPEKQKDRNIANYSTIKIYIEITSVDPEKRYVTLSCFLSDISTILASNINAIRDDPSFFHLKHVNFFVVSHFFKIINKTQVRTLRHANTHSSQPVMSHK